MVSKIKSSKTSHPQLHPPQQREELGTRAGHRVSSVSGTCSPRSHGGQEAAGPPALDAKVTQPGAGLAAPACTPDPKHGPTLVPSSHFLYPTTGHPTGDVLKAPQIPQHLKPRLSPLNFRLSQRPRTAQDALNTPKPPSLRPRSSHACPAHGSC